MKELIAEYRKTIEALSVALGAGNNARVSVCDLSRELEQIEASVIAAGVDGKNAEERKANLTLTLASISDYQRVRGRLDEQKRIAAEYERKVDVAREMCRLLRLSIACGADDGVRELAA